MGKQLSININGKEYKLLINGFRAAKIFKDLTGLDFATYQGDTYHFPEYVYSMIRAQQLQDQKNGLTVEFIDLDDVVDYLDASEVAKLIAAIEAKAQEAQAQGEGK